MATPPLQLHAGRYLQSPVWHFHHPDTGRTISLIGMVHEGEPRYFQHVLQVVADVAGQGAVVHHEGTRLGEYQRNPPEHATDLERELLALHPGASDTVRTMPGWTDQFTGIGGRWPADWRRHDLDEIQLMRALGHERYRTYVRDAAAAPAGSRLARWHQVAGRRFVMCQNYRLWAYGRDEPTDRVFVDQRNAAALQGVDGTDADLVLLWGVGHLPGIADGLEQRGFLHVDTSWLTVGRLPRLWQVVLMPIPLIALALCLRLASYAASRWARLRRAASRADVKEVA